MGTDIHLFVEKKNKETGLWEMTKGPNPRIANYRENAKDWEERGNTERAAELLKKADEIENGTAYAKAVELEKEYRAKYPECYSENSRSIEDECDYDAPLRKKDWLYSGRNYDLFAILADVRNGRGFAGIPTGEGFNPIADPRGVPEDASDEYKAEVEHWDCDGHSHSYHTLAQLKAYDWNQETKSRVVLDEEPYKKYKETGELPEYWGIPFGRDIEHVTPEQMDEIIAGNVLREEGKQYCVNLFVPEKYHECVGSFYTESIPTLEKLSEDGEGNDVRIVFFFDN